MPSIISVALMSSISRKVVDVVVNLRSASDLLVVFTLLESIVTIAPNTRVTAHRHCEATIFSYCAVYSDLHCSCQFSQLFQVMAHLLLLLELLSQHLLLFICLMLKEHGLLHRFVGPRLALLLVFMEVVEAVLNAFLVHRHPLLEYVQGSRDDVKLGDHLLEGKGKFFSRSGDASTRRASHVSLPSSKLLISISCFIQSGYDVHALFLSTRHRRRGATHLTLVGITFGR